jgi:hypothetical protein
MEVQLTFFDLANKALKVLRAKMETSKNAANTMYDAEDPGGLPDAFRAK